MRLLLVEHDARLRAQLRRHVCAVWPDALLTGHPPDAAGPLPPEFLAQGFDAVLLAESWPGGDGQALRARVWDMPASRSQSSSAAGAGRAK